MSEKQKRNVSNYDKNSAKRLWMWRVYSSTSVARAVAARVDCCCPKFERSELKGVEERCVERREAVKARRSSIRSQLACAGGRGGWTMMIVKR